VFQKKGNVMLKTLGILIGGVFVGAVGAEVLNKKYPGVLEKLYTKPREMACEMKEAFKNGYRKVNQSKTATA
jgi:hypothetical protein